MTSYFAATAESDVNQTYARSQADGRTARLAGGNVVAVWRDYQSGVATGQALKLRLFKPNGDPLGNEITAVDLPNGGFGSSVAALTTGGFAISWVDSGVLHARVFDANGAATTATLNLGATNTRTSEPTSIVGLAGGGFALTWSDQRTTGADLSGTSVHLICLNASGAVVAADQQVNITTAGNQIGVSSTALTGGGFVVSWCEGNLAQQKARLYNAQGQALSGEIALTPTGAGSAEPRITALADGGFATLYNNGFQNVQRYNAQGVAVGAKITVTSSNYATDDVDIVALSDGGLAIAYLGYLQQGDASGACVIVQAFDANGATSGPVRANVGTLGDQDQPKLTALDNGAFMVTWTDHASGGDSVQVKSRIFAPTIAFQGDLSKWSVFENATLVGAVAAVSQTAGASLTYSLAGGADAGLFAIDGRTGQLSLVKAQDYEAPGDVGADRVYDVIVRVSDGVNSADGALRVSLKDVVNEYVTITSLGGADAATLTAFVDVGAFTKVAAVSPIGRAVSYAIAGGLDAALFTIDAASGALAFKQAPDYVHPADANGDGIYNVVVSASDGVSVDTQALAISPKLNHAPTISSFAGADSASPTIAENVKTVATMAATDADGQSLTWSLSGVDAASFVLNANTGALSFINAPDYENPADANRDRIYDVMVSVSDGLVADTQALHIGVTNVNEPFVFTGASSSYNIAVNVKEGATAVMTLTAVDPDGGAISWGLAGGADAAQFAIDAKTGQLSFLTPQSYATPKDVGADHVYNVIVSAFDGAWYNSRSVAVTVQPANLAPVITSNGGADSASISFAENQTAVMTLAANDPEGAVPIWSLSGGVDAARFAINSQTGALRFVSAPDYEKPTDANLDNIYDVVVSASDGLVSDTQALRVTVANVNETPVITSGGGGDTASVSMAENTTAAMSLTATDPEGAALSWSVVGGVDSAKFTILNNTLKFLNAPDYEAPTDYDADNVYELKIGATDGVNWDFQLLRVSVLDVLETGTGLNGTQGADILTGTTNADTIYGLGGNDVINGNAGDDLLCGGAGSDTITGGLGADTFSFTALSDSPFGGEDVVTDFHWPENDKIDLTTIDANTLVAGDQAFTFLYNSTFTGVAGQLREDYYSIAGTTLVQGDVNGDKIVDFQIKLTGSIGLASIDFKL